MNNPALIALIQNAALLLAMVAVFDIMTTRQRLVNKPVQQALVGVVLGAFCIGVMMASFVLRPGIIFDTRSVLLCISGLFLGTIPTVVAMAMAVVFRASQGGAAAVMGVSVILATGTLGIVWRKCRRGPLENVTGKELYCFGVVAHVIMLLLALTLPWETAKEVLAGIGLPVMVIYPVATMVLGLLMANRLRHEGIAVSSRKGEERLRLALEAARMGIFDWDMLKNRLTWSEWHERLWGYEVGEFKGTFDDFRERLHTDDVAKVEAEVARCTAARCSFSQEFRVVWADGSLHWISAAGEFDFDSTGRAVRMRGTVVEITERKRAEEAVRLSSERLELIARTTGSVVGKSSVAEVADSLTRMVRDCFAADACVMRELDGENLVLLAAAGVEHQALPQHMPVYGLGAEILRTRKALIVPDVRDHELTRDQPPQQIAGRLFLSFAGVPLAVQDEVIGILGIYTTDRLREFSELDVQHLQIVADSVAIALANERLFRRVADQRDRLEAEVAERERAEEERERLQSQLTQAQKMESVGRLAGGVAHDFNNMLSVILGHAELLLERLPSNDPLAADIREIRRAAERSADITRQLLAFARKQTVTPRLLELNATVEGMLRMLRRLIGEDVALEWRPGREVACVRIDPSQVDQILVNLCVNARDAIGGVGTISIATTVEEIGDLYRQTHPWATTGQYARLSVSDTGCGMSKETMARLFEPFFTTKELGRGTGLGLATVYGTVKQNGGFIDVVSEPDRGTQFLIFLPHHDQPAEVGAVQPVKEAAAKPRRETILLVEDEPQILKMTTMMLERQGYSVLQAGSPTDALRLADTHPGRIDLLLTDVVMPEMNGRDLAASIAQRFPGIRRLFMSGYTADVIAHHGIVEEGVAFIQKPFVMKDLAAKVQETLAQ
ncbi:MAG: response regulator [Candidatus Sumerlaeia bacterium]|nr:response regulator [Candidatus Sumerlaeia bacterium]